jgi:UDP-3-O-[3-hydroxymyristoyl] glucosamine N-acyltransferase
MANLAPILRELRVPFEVCGRAAADDFDDVRPLDEAGARSLVFVGKQAAQSLDALSSSPARLFVVEEKWATAVREGLDAIEAAFFLVGNPRLVMARVLRVIRPDEDAWPSGVHPTASVHPEAAIHPTASIGAYSIIGRCTIGEHSRVGNYCVIHDRTVVGRRVDIRDHCTIGGAGFGFVRNEDRRLLRIPHVGGVIIEDDVEIFPYANVDRGTLVDTRIGRGTKIDHYVHVGHNTVIGEDAVITAGVVTCGSSRVGSRAWVGVGSIVKESTRVGDDTTIGLGSVVLKPVADGETVAGVPAKPIVKS